MESIPIWHAFSNNRRKQNVIGNLKRRHKRHDMNNYIRLLLHLKQFDGDGKLHPVEHIFPDTSTDDIKSILNELSEEGLIKFVGRETRYLSFVVSKNILTGETSSVESPFNDQILNSEPDPFKAKITFKGSKYLKEELQMQESGKYNIAVTGQGATNNFVIESQNVTINNKANFATRADNIIDTINNDNSIDNDIKAKVINDLTVAKKQVEQNGNVSGDTMKNILEYGSNISSIGQLILGLFTL